MNFIFFLLFIDCCSFFFFLALLWFLQLLHKLIVPISLVFQNQNLRQTCQPSRKRQFDVASLLAPDDQLESLRPIKTRKFSCSEDEHDLQEPEAEPDHEEEDVDVDVDVEVDGGSEVKPLLSPVTPSASPESKMSPLNGHCNWSSPSLQSNICQPISGIHLHNHLHFKNYYVPSNSSPGSSI